MQIIKFYPKKKKNRRVFEHTQHACLEASVIVCVTYDLSIYKYKWVSVSSNG